MFPSSIETHRLTLRRPAMSDAADIYRNYASNPHVTRYLSWPVHRSIGDAERFLTYLNEEIALEREFSWAIIERNSAKLCGMIGVMFRPPGAFLGYCLAEEVWGRGYAAEAAEMVIPLVWTRPDIGHLAAFCHTQHTRSARVLEKSGLRYVGIDQTHVVLPACGPHRQDMLHYELQRPKGLGEVARPRGLRVPC